MSYDARLIHTLTVVRRTYDDDVADRDEYGQPVSSTSEDSVQGLPQLKGPDEMAAISQAGAALGEWTIFLAFDATLDSNDRIEHRKIVCPVRNDLPEMAWEVTGRPDNAAGIGHHLEVDARAVSAGATAVGS